MIKVFRDEWGPTRARPHPLGERAVIRFALQGDVGTSHDDENGDEGDGDSSKDDEDTAQMDDGEAVRDSNFLRWLDEHLGQRDYMSLHVRTLVNRLGRFRAEQRLRTRAVQDLARVLSAGGYSTDPDLRSMTRSPGIETRVTVERPGRRGERGAV